MLQLTGNSRLAEEPPGGWRIAWAAIGQQFDGDFTVEDGVAGAVDYAHAPVAERLDQLVARRTGGTSGSSRRRPPRAARRCVSGLRPRHPHPRFSSGRLRLSKAIRLNNTREPTRFPPDTQDCRIAVVLGPRHSGTVPHAPDRPSFAASRRATYLESVGLEMPTALQIRGITARIVSRGGHLGWLNSESIAVSAASPLRLRACKRPAFGSPCAE